MSAGAIVAELPSWKTNFKHTARGLGLAVRNKAIELGVRCHTKSEAGVSGKLSHLIDLLGHACCIVWQVPTHDIDAFSIINFESKAPWLESLQADLVAKLGSNPALSALGNLPKYKLAAKAMTLFESVLQVCRTLTRLIIKNRVYTPMIVVAAPCAGAKGIWRASSYKYSDAL